MADTSTIINLNASGCAAAVLRALPNRVVVDGVRSWRNFGFDKRTGRDDAKLVRSLINADLAAVAAVADLQQDHFEGLVTGPAVETLGDGEAATIACALETNAVAIIDDRKAVTLCARKYPNLVVANTIDLFAHDAVVSALGRGKLRGRSVCRLAKGQNAGAVPS